jgi:hypothetical protein
MKNNVILLLLLPVLAAHCFSQKTPVVITSSTSGIEKNEMAMKFTKSLSDEVQLSGKFYYWISDSKALPPGGIEIKVHSIPVELTGAGAAGAAIFVEAVTFCPKDRAYSRTVNEQMFVFPRDASVADHTRGFLAEVDRLR